ncbi:uncharacterized protein LOC135821686 [Sycon ciliatum]|uniref:uncharacterized protein LOC135821686 n=1 Tax=Sycon ciliatum TaxID=27933 RepID=UPI0031F5F325
MSDGDGQAELSGVVALTKLVAGQMQAAKAREQQLSKLFQDTLKSLQQQQQQPTGLAPTSTRSTPTSAPTPKPLSQDRPMLLSTASLADFATWEEAWDNYSACQQLASHGLNTRVSALRQAFDEDLRRFLREGIIPIGANDDVHVIIAAVKKYLRRLRNPLLDRLAFYNRKQSRAEPFDAFYTSLRESYNACDFPDLSLCTTCSGQICGGCKSILQVTHDVLRDRIVVGISNEETRHKLLATPDLTLDAAIKLCRAEEAASDTSHNIPGQAHVNAARKSAYQQQKRQSASNSFPKSSAAPKARVKCPNCGRSAHTKSACPAIGKLCNRCKVAGHFQSMCPKRKKQTQIGMLKVRRAQESGSDTVRLATKLCTEPQPVQLQWIPDTGSDIDAIGIRQLSLLGGFVENLDSDFDDVRTASDDKLVTVGKICVTLQVNDQSHDSVLHVFDGLDDALLSRSSLRALNFLPPGWPQQVARVSAPRTPSPTDLVKIRSQLLEEFSDVFDDSTLKPMSGPPMDIVLEPDAKPHRVYTARPVAYAYREKVKAQLDDMVSEGIVETVSDPSDWCHPIVIVDKKGSTEKRLTVDLQTLNRQVKRPTHPMRNARECLSAMGPATFCRNPQGLVSAGDEFNRRTDSAFDGLQNFFKIVDDGLVHNVSFDDHLVHVRAVLQRARDHGITLSAKKFTFAASTVEFCGFTVSSDGYTVDPAKTSAIQNFSTPSNRTDLRSFLGLVNQCSVFTPRLAELAAPLRPLLKTSNEFVWDSVHTAAFDATKAELVSPSVLSFFQHGNALRLETDASVLNGLGYALWQLQDDKWRLLQCGSRFLSDAETRYAVIELELLAAVWAVHKCSLFLSGALFELCTDHRPLIPILNSYSLDQIENPRLQRLTLKLCPYQFIAKWRKGTDNAFADALSRHPVDTPHSDEEFGENPALGAPTVRACLRQDDDCRSVDLRFSELLEAARADPDYQALVHAVRHGFPTNSANADPAVKPYLTVREHLSVDSDLVLKGQRVVVPRALRSRVLQDLHAAHQGLTRAQRRARQIVFWPIISNDIANTVRSCEMCRLHAPSQCKEPFRVTEDRRPTLPFESVSADLFSCQGWEFLVYADRHTGWPCVAKLGRTASSLDIIHALRRWFADTVVPRVLTTDGGPQFSSRRFADFCSRWQVDHSTSSPHFPQSNGHAESAAKAMKLLIAKTTVNGDINLFQRGLLEWRNTPRSHGWSPAQALYGRPLTSFVIAHHTSFAPEWQAESDSVDAAAAKQSAAVGAHYDDSAHPLPPLRIGCRVDLQDPRSKLWHTSGVIVAVGRNRDYLVKVPSGRTYWRNHRFLRPVTAAVIPPAPTCTPPASNPAANVASPDPQPLRRSQRSRTAPNRLDIASHSTKSYD